MEDNDYALWDAAKQGAAALLMWIDFMREALDGVEEQPLPQLYTRPCADRPGDGA